MGNTKPTLVFLIVSQLTLACRVQHTIESAESTSPPSGAVQLDQSAIIGVFEPTCQGQPNLDPELATYRRLIDLSCNTLGSPLIQLHAADLKATLRSANRSFVGVVLMGHGFEDETRSALCSSGDSSKLYIDELAKALSPTANGGVFIVNSCFSARVDPREAKSPLSIISASPFAVRTDSLFGEVLAQSLVNVGTDPNCDGVITDQELYDEIVSQLTSRMSVSGRPAFPKLRRNATSDIPLPILPVLDGHCSDRRAEIEDLASNHSETWGDLGLALNRQLALRHAVETHGAAKLPEVKHDYYTLVKTTNPDKARAVERIARESGLIPLPTGAVTNAPDIASFITFADIYEISEQCDWYTIRRLRDGTILGSSRLKDLGASIPKRDSKERPANGLGDPVRRRVGMLTLSKSEIPVPCYGGTGQCFEVQKVKGGPNAQQQSMNSRNTQQ